MRRRDFLTGIVVSSTVTEDNSSVEDSVFVSHLRGISEKCANVAKMARSSRHPSDIMALQTGGLLGGWLARFRHFESPAFKQCLEKRRHLDARGRDRTT
jgi:hypothetical protein